MLYTITKEQKTELEEARKANKKKSVDRRLRALIMRGEGKQSNEIAQATEYHPAYISELVSKYCNEGLSAIIDNHYHGNRRNMSFDEEKALLETFKSAAEAGQIVEVSEIKKAYEEAIHRSLDSSRGQIYRVLDRHDWRKVMPRSKHPNKASDEEIESSKKLKTESPS
jgi:transposase